MIVLGMTGSIGMGKTETAHMFRALGVPVYDADQAVHDLYKKGGAGVDPIEQTFPGVCVDGAIDRERLSAQVMNDAAAFRKLEQIIHPLVRTDQKSFMAELIADHVPLVVLDVPLLFEGGGHAACDRVVVVSAPAAVQRQRVLARPGMSEEKFNRMVKAMVSTIDTEDLAREINSRPGDYVVELETSDSTPGARILRTLARDDYLPNDAD
ncbi:MAG TPA: dephospho-CoA kinase, partial [Sneathiellales bacterium]|nr:dephospho-CoA kinase [Sneathiellales bacterium]